MSITQPRTPRRSTSARMGPFVTPAVILSVAVGTGVGLHAQESEPAVEVRAEVEKGQALPYQRRVQLPQAIAPAVVTAEFFTHGELRDDPRGKGLNVSDNQGNAVPWRVLQVGPGDFCRIAFQPVPRQRLYKIGYGGRGSANAHEPPPWTARVGLVLDTRPWRDCDLRSEDSVRSAFQAGDLAGAGYVPSVFHRFNPFNPDPAPFLSEYRGSLEIPSSGLYRFYTSSQDCSYLRVDGKLVVAAPGWHGPAGHARHKGEVRLDAGVHNFRYLHAAAGTDACMVAAWQPPGSNQIEPIPPAAFGSASIVRLPAPSARFPREYEVDIQDEVPLADSDKPLIRVHFRHVASRASTSRPRLHWDFGDGQASTQADPVHIYLHPGLYTVAMKGVGESEKLAFINRVAIHRPLVFVEPGRTPDSLDQYLPLLDKVNPAKLDPSGLLQLERAFVQANLPDRAVKAVALALAPDGPPLDADSSMDAVRLATSLARDRLDQPDQALALWKCAAGRAEPPAWKAESALAAAEICLYERLRPDEAGPLLAAAVASLGSAGPPALMTRLDRLKGDWLARKGDREGARACYLRAGVRARASDRRSAAQGDAWRGALSRSSEEFLRAGDLDRAREQLVRWQEDYPDDKLEGYLTLLLARYWSARGMPAVAIALASDLLTVNRDSPYADALVFMAAECEQKLGRPERARAQYQTLLAEYPGSPLVSEARDRLSASSGRPAAASRKP